jgi:hypothetical protein
MTWTAAADAVMSACARAAAACPPTVGITTGRTAPIATALACPRPVLRAARGCACVLGASHGPAVPTARGPRRHPGRPERARLPRLRYLAGLPRQRGPGGVRRLHLLRADLATPGWPSDPGRGAL